MNQSTLVAVTSIALAALGGAAVALKITFNKRNEIRGDGNTARSVRVRGHGNITAGRDISGSGNSFDPRRSAESGQQNEAD